ncbi:ABC transporter ATP-binding protein [Leuconostoc suionicum]|uniref:Hemin import ATP-binding protein HrtA n=1 Tax=Leuconostoc suionicum TaxID=1511761 RepID=A0A2N9K8U8_9LACO|nr:ABC transporter ATP-binding protein [Leuconostoc suionicum]API71871.1 peptide ABC transporter ATP-binding protein [Leuconostoc suionicum]MCT4376513.1 ABC transporter ATP-binding protein [Leuconostoc suionicum]MCT4402675.1 ABC transporter ATP-binding protein [Leuconostoc suionicum]MDI6522538.1 ABC transporter ATP-binding protein [Leuconostoc suionicum]MDI6544228.1 ABC transporter ATP-binding protein [Leuconostoc suionicum]
MARLEFENVSKKYGTGTSEFLALDNVNFSADSRQLILVVGPSGSGKTTFLTIAGGLQSPTAGTVKINDEIIGELSKKEQSDLRLNTVGFILQSYNLVPYLTVNEQFELVDRVKKQHLSHEEFRTVLKTLAIEDLGAKYPNELSGGQRQRVAIARALYADPEYILADEPTASLDTARSKEVMSLLRELAHKNDKTIIVVTHDLRLKEEVDKVYQIIDGKMSKIDDGKFSKI